MSNFFKPVSFVTLVSAFYKKSLEDAFKCYSLFHWFSIRFHCFSCFSGRCPIFLSPFHSLHLFQHQADCVYKKSLLVICFLFIFIIKMSNLFKHVSFVTLCFRQMLVTSCYSLFH